MSKFVNGVIVELSDAEIEERSKSAADAVKDLEVNGYKYNRKVEYPSIEDQLDQIYHEGIDAWKATIKATKDKYPKP